MAPDPQREARMSIEQSTGGGSDDALATLTPIEARILGCLIEKQATTPETYPLTANAVVVACNQKTNREPTMELEPGDVGHALREMTGKGLVRIVDGARAQRFEHKFATTYSVTSRQQALLAVMLLRGPQTLAELQSRGERLGAPADVDDVRLALERLMQRAPAPALVANLGRAPGQREDRYMHLLCGPVSAAEYATAATEDASAPRRGALEARVEALEAEVEALRRELEALRDR
jgi:uncharacterized protein YceH (UPF0502 family)